MCESDGKGRVREWVKSVRQKRDNLPPESHIRNALGEDVFDGVSQHIERTDAKDLLYGCWPPLFELVGSQSDRAISELDANINLAVAASDSRKVKLFCFSSNRSFPVLELA